jgi:hypothetical protein
MPNGFLMILNCQKLKLATELPLPTLLFQTEDAMKAKFLNFIIFLLFFQDSLQYSKILRMRCNTTKISAINPLCKIRPVSRTNMSISVGTEVIRTIQQYFVSSSTAFRWFKQDSVCYSMFSFVVSIHR